MRFRRCIFVPGLPTEPEVEEEVTIGKSTSPSVMSWNEIGADEEEEEEEEDE